MSRKAVVVVTASVVSVLFAGWGGFELYQLKAPSAEGIIPTTTVKRGDIQFTVSAQGELRGGNSEILAAPMTGAREMVITDLRKPGELVNEGDVVVQFDTTEQEFELREAEADLAEAEQHVVQAKAESEAREEESRYALLHAKAQVRLAELEVRKDPLMPAITARQNTLALQAAEDALRQLEHDLANRKATTEAGVAIQEAARQKAKVKADMARRNIEAMTLKAKSKGYVSINRNTQTNFFMSGMDLPIFQIGDTTRPGMTVAEIPDLENWEVTTQIGELDRGHLGKAQKADITVIALPGKTFTGEVNNIGGTTGPPWDRRFECKLSIADPSPELRPGMSAKVTITTGVLRDALWVPSQALFESDGRTFVYGQTESGFRPADVKLVRRSESQVVLAGLSEGQVVALASPEQQVQGKGKAKSPGVMQAVPKR